jgi:hypothetical protein
MVGVCAAESSRKLAYFYLANDILQKARKKIPE